MMDPMDTAMRMGRVSSKRFHRLAGSPPVYVTPSTSLMNKIWSSEWIVHLFCKKIEFGTRNQAVAWGRVGERKGRLCTKDLDHIPISHCSMKWWEWPGEATNKKDDIQYKVSPVEETLCRPLVFWTTTPNSMAAWEFPPPQGGTDWMPSPTTTAHLQVWNKQRSSLLCFGLLSASDERYPGSGR